jgi:hypothetical protein
MLLRFLFFSILACGNLLALGSASPQGAFAYSVSAFRQSAPMRRAVEAAEKNFLALTGYAVGEAPPILLETYPKGFSPRLSVNALEGGGPEIRLLLPKDPDDPQVPQFLTTALLLRQYYGKTAPVPGSSVPRYPSWMSRGLGELLSERTVEDYSSESSSPEMEAFLSERVPDPENVSLLRHYDMLASVLVRSGLSDEQGRKSFREWIGSYDPGLPVHQPSPWIGGWEMRAMERRWNLGLQKTNRKNQMTGVILGAPATLEGFRRTMQEGLSGQNSLKDVADERGGEFRLQQLSQKLAALRLQANPLAIPMIEHAMRLVTSARRTSRGRIRREEETIRRLQLELGKQARAIEDYLDWCEATKVSSMSGLFDAYLASPVAPSSKGPVGRALDTVESRGW